MQANAKVTEEVIGEQTSKIEGLTKALNEHQLMLKELEDRNSENESTIIQDMQNKLNDGNNQVQKLQSDLNDLNNKYRDYDSVKNQATHVDTFKNELMKAREETQNVRSDLQRKLDELTSTSTIRLNELTSTSTNRLNELANELATKHKNEIDGLLNKQKEESLSVDKKVAELLAQIEYLQLPPAKRKKLDELNKQESVVTQIVDADGTVKDGGSF
jgi:uncharacterized phage infection (PIP) family protein YhgE